MSIVHVNQIKSFIEKQLANLIDLSDANARIKDRLLLARGLAALAAMHVSGISKEEAAASVTDGGGDNGIDAVVVTPSKNQIFLIQSKWNDAGTKSIELGEMLKFKEGCKRVISLKWDGFNSKFDKVKEDVELALENPNVQIQLVVAYPSTSQLSDECLQPINEFLEENNQVSEICFLGVVGLAELMSVVTEQVTGKIKNIEATLFEWGRAEQKLEAVYGQVACSDIAMWFEENGVKLFSPNIRSFLGASDVNAGMVKTLLSDPTYFWYANNGITAICSSISKKAIGGNTRDSGSFVFEDLRIVNGAQTVGSIHEAWKKNANAVEQARVYIRIISKKGAVLNFESDITTKTNTQNRIEAKDFAALDPNQSRLKQELFHLNINYVYRSGETYGSQDNGFDIQEGVTALACTAKETSFAVLAKRNIGDLLDPKSKNYTALFNNELSGDALWNSVKRLRSVDSIINAIRREKTGRASQLAVHGNRVLAHIALQIFSQHTDLDEIKKSVRGVFDETWEYVEKNYPDAYLAILFKNSEKCQKLATTVINTLTKQ